MAERKSLKNSTLVLYSAVFYAIWSARELLLRPLLEDSFGEWSNAFIGTAIKLLIWTLPAVLLIKYFESDMWLSLKEMVSHKAKWLWYVLILAGFLLYYSAAAYFTFGTISVHPDFKAVSLIGTVLFVGVTEEVLFRGWLLNAFMKKLKPWYAVLLSSVMFMLVHLPIWAYRGQLSNPLTALTNCLLIIALGVVFSWTFVKSKNIFVPIILHMGWNLFTIVFFG